MIRHCRLITALLLLSLWPLSAHAFFHTSPGEPLRAEEAYRVEAIATGDGLRIEWRIEEGYYLYRDKMHFSSETPGIELGAPVLPAGEMREDEFFGKQVIYRNRAVIQIPLLRAPGSADSLTLAIGSQGCADIGICYPPRTERLDVALPALPAPPVDTQQTGEEDKVNDLIALLGGSGAIGGGDDDFLPAEEAFAFDAIAEAADTIVVRWRIADGYYLYRDKFSFEIEGEGLTLGAPDFPPGEEKDDPYFGMLEVYRGDVAITLPLWRTIEGRGIARLTAGYQGCAEGGICYPPLTTTAEIELPPITAAQIRALPVGTSPTTTQGVEFEEVISEQDGIAQSLSNGNTLLIVATFFGFGLLLSFTPCVFPMIPILSGIIVGQGARITTTRAFMLSLAYVLAMAATYTVAGVLAGLFGGNLQAAFQEPWILATFSAVFVLLSLSMFGFYELQVPSWMQSRMATLSNRQHGGTLVGAAVMGALSALIVGPCVAAPLAGALIYIGQTGDALLGGTALFALSMGMGAPLLLIGTSAGKLLPRAGAWMDAVKAVFGVMLLAVAIFMLERIIPGPVAMLLWAALLIVSAIYLGALQSLPASVSGWHRLWKGVGVIMLIYGVMLMVGAGLGNSDPYRPLHGLRGVDGGGAVAVHEGLVFKPVKSLADVRREVAAASTAGRTVMLDFYADWCVSCKEMERDTFSDRAVQSALANTLTLQADVTDNDAIDQELLDHYGLIGPPTLLFFGPDGRERRGYRIMGFMGPEAFASHVNRALR